MATEAVSSDYMDIAQLRFSLTCSGAPDKDGLKAKLMAHIKEKEMAPFYRATCDLLGWPVDEAWLAEMEAANTAELATLAEKLETAKEKDGEATGSGATA